MHQALTIIVSAQVGAAIAFMAFALIFAGGAHGDDSPAKARDTE